MRETAPDQGSGTRAQDNAYPLKAAGDRLILARNRRARRRALSSPAVTEGTVWEPIDEPVLRWVASLPPSLEMRHYELELREPRPFEPSADLTSQDVHHSLLRLQSHGLIDGREARPTASSIWSRLRVTAFGWIVLGEWPDLDRVATAASLHRLLRALAEDAPEDERSALVRAAGVVSRTADEVIRGTAADVAGTVGREATD